MSASLIVMLIFINGHNGPATITGFASLLECESAESTVRNTYDTLIGWPPGKTTTKCLWLGRRVAR